MAPPRTTTHETFSIEHSKRFFDGAPTFGVFCLIAAALFATGAAWSSPVYFTSWALYLHGTYFALVALSEFWLSLYPSTSWTAGKFSRNEWQFRWIFVPASSIAVAVAVAVTYILYALWGEYYEDYCTVSRKCRDEMIAFIVAHYAPPIIYFMNYVLRDAFVSRAKRTPAPEMTTLGGNQESSKVDVTSQRSRYWLIVFQVGMLPTFLYGSVLDPEVVYGDGTKFGGVFVYTATMFAWTWVVTFPPKSLALV
jgi:hypothetical protein